MGWEVPAAGLRQRALGWRISLFVCVLVNWITQLNTKRPRGQELSRVDSQKDGMITEDSIKTEFFLDPVPASIRSEEGEEDEED